MAATNIPIPETMYPIVKSLPSVVWERGPRSRLSQSSRQRSKPHRAKTILQRSDRRWSRSRSAKGRARRSLHLRLLESVTQALKQAQNIGEGTQGNLPICLQLGTRRQPLVEVRLHHSLSADPKSSFSQSGRCRGVHGLDMESPKLRRFARPDTFKTCTPYHVFARSLGH